MATPIILEVRDLRVPPRLCGHPRNLPAPLFTLRGGERLCVYGHSGAGKTTLLRALLGLIPYQGEVVWHVPRPSTGYAAQRPRLIPRATTIQQILWSAQLHNVFLSPHGSRIHELLEQFDLGKHRHKAVSRLSPGEQAKLELCCALAVASHLLVVDGLLEALDEPSRARFWEEVDLRCARRELALIYATHSAREAEMADYVLLLHEGRLLAIDTPGHLRSRASTTIVRLQPVPHSSNQQSMQVSIRLGEQGIMMQSGETTADITLQHMPTMEDALNALLRQEEPR